MCRQQYASKYSQAPTTLQITSSCVRGSTNSTTPSLPFLFCKILLVNDGTRWREASGCTKKINHALRCTFRLESLTLVFGQCQTVHMKDRTAIYQSLNPFNP